MKYRGVVAVSQELINKFSGFSGFDKQSKAIKAKMNYEKELEKIGDSCQTAYNELYEARKQKHTSVTQDILGYEIEADCENKIELFKDPNALLLVHPECRQEVVEQADYVGSTTGIMNYAKKSDCREFIIGTGNSIAIHIH